MFDEELNMGSRGNANNMPMSKAVQGTVSTGWHRSVGLFTYQKKKKRNSPRRVRWC